VALLSALRQVNGETPTAGQLVDDALHVENVILGNINGGQDQYASALGGFHAFAFGSERVDVQPLSLDHALLESIEERSVLCYSGDSRVSGDVLDQVMAQYTAGDRRTAAALRTIRGIARETAQALADGSLDDLGALIQATGDIQRHLHPAMTPPAVHRLLDIGRSHGVDAAKMAGAGGGGCVYFFCPPERREGLAQALASHGVPLLAVQFSPAGVLTAGTGV
jgi:D-glycero-alpha-D-manno-heptose-7-phosphate kinase